MRHANYPLRTSIALVLLFGPLIVSRLGFGTKRMWGGYALVITGFFGVFALAGWLVSMGMNLTGEIHLLQPLASFAEGSFIFACCAFVGGAFAEKAAGKMRRF